VFHVELRQFPHVARAFNLTREQLEARILTAWTRGEAVEFDDRRWSPDRARLTIYDARELATDEIGLGRGWAAATRHGENVTARLLEQYQSRIAPAAEPADAKVLLLERAMQGPVELAEVVGVVGVVGPGGARRPSELLALAEQAVWELLHEGKLTLTRDGATLVREQWQSVLLSWTDWTGRGPSGVSVEIRDA
jgi:hypothetical protein